MRRKDFEKLVAEALDDLPEEFLEKLDNLAVVVEEEATVDEKVDAGLYSDDILFGIYQGIPLTQRGSGYSFVEPDRIVIYQRPFDRLFESDKEKIYEVRKTVIHEIAHHFGISDERLDELDY